MPQHTKWRDRIEGSMPADPRRQGARRRWGAKITGNCREDIPASCENCLGIKLRLPLLDRFARNLLASKRHTENTVENYKISTEVALVKENNRILQNIYLRRLICLLKTIPAKSTVLTRF